jgi:hypothetical protein
MIAIQSDGHDFSCDCGDPGDRGSLDLDIKHTYEMIVSSVDYLPCECGEGVDERAASQKKETRCFYTQHGRFAEETYDWQPAECEENTDESSEIEVSCQACYDAALEAGLEWENEEEDQELDEDSGTFVLTCHVCGIELGSAVPA